MKIQKSYYLIPILISALGWQFASLYLSNSNLLPSPFDVALALIFLTKSGELFIHIKASMLRLIAGLILGSIFGILIGITTGRIKSVDKSLSPIFNVLRSFPPVSIIPLVIVWFGIGEVAKIFSISFAVLFPVWMNTHIGASSIPVRYIQATSTLGCSKLKRLLMVIFPASFPFIFAGLRSGISTAYIMIFVSELAGASSGIGYLISVSHLAYRMDSMIAGILLLGLFGAATDYALSSTRRIFPWMTRM